MSLRVIAFVDHEIGYRLLEKMISYGDSNKFELVAVATTVENGEMWWPGVADLCLKANVPLFRYQEPFTETLAFENIDWYFLLSWKHIIPEKLINHPNQGVINLHYSLLPEYRGVYPVNWAIIDGNDTTGVTYHLVDKKVDHGEIILQTKAPILISDTSRTLQLRLDNLAYELFDCLLDWITKVDLNKDAHMVPVKKPGSYKSKTDFKEMCEIDLGRQYMGADFLNLLRGMTFLSDSKNAFVIDQKTRKRIFIKINMEVEE